MLSTEASNTIFESFYGSTWEELRSSAPLEKNLLTIFKIHKHMVELNGCTKISWLQLMILWSLGSKYCNIDASGVFIKRRTNLQKNFICSHAMKIFWSVWKHFSGHTHTHTQTHTHTHTHKHTQAHTQVYIYIYMKAKLT